MGIWPRLINAFDHDFIDIRINFCKVTTKDNVMGINAVHQVDQSDTDPPADPCEGQFHCCRISN